MRLSEKLSPASAVTIMSLLICLGMAYVADLVGMSAVMVLFLPELRLDKLIIGMRLMAI